MAQIHISISSRHRFLPLMKTYVYLEYSDERKDSKNLHRKTESCGEQSHAKKEKAKVHGYKRESYSVKLSEI